MRLDMRPAYISVAIVLAACEGQDVARRESTGVRNEPRQLAVAPPFGDYAVADTSLDRPRPATVDISSAPYGRMYRTKLNEGAAAGPNFAGHYTVVLWGCGTGCQIVSVVDARSGRLSSQTLLAAAGVQYRRDSRLLYADPPQPDQPANCASCGTPGFYEWRDGRFRPVGTGPHPHVGGPRPWGTECVPGDTFPGSATGHYTCPERGN
jgi:hypothetical protein